MLLLVDSFVGWVLLPCSFMFTFLLYFFHLLADYLPRVSVSTICISYQFLSPYSASCRTGNSSPLSSSGIRKRLYSDIPVLKGDSLWDFQCFSQAQPPPERLRGEDGRNPQKCAWAHLTLFWLTISGISEDYYELMEFSAFRIPRWLQVVFEAFLFYNVCFSLEKEKNRLGLGRGVTETWG